MDERGSRRRGTLETVADDIVERTGAGSVRVAVDGIDGAGKTYFADELAAVLQRRGVPVIRASVDDFHQPAEVRYRRGRNSPEGFLLDSYDDVAFTRLLLEPLGPGGDGRFVRAIHDVDAERAVHPVVEVAPASAVLVVDGIFLHRPELRDHWDYSVFLDVDVAVSIPRGAQRGLGDPDPEAASNRRYVEGQRLYLESCRPRQLATVVIDNNDLADAHIVRRTDSRRRPTPATGDERA